ncbi:MAG: hypothetical protein ACI4CE_07370 [Methanomethylophilus alvi]
MIGKRENTAKTLVRIEAIVLQGLLMGMFLTAMGIVMIPVMPFVVVYNRWRAEKKRHRFITRVWLTPFWFVSGIMYSLLSPIGIVWKTVADIRTVVAVEWATRTLDGEPKKPNGHPIELPTAYERERRDLAKTVGVIRDYNAAARAHGQGLPIDERKL